MFNKVILIGNLTRDIEVRYLPSGSAVANLGLATNRKWKDKQTNETREEVMFIDISLFGRQAEIANQYLRRGSKVLVEGRLVFEQWVDNNGQKRSKHKIAADSVKFLDTKEQSSNNNYQNSGSYTPSTNSYQQNNSNTNSNTYNNNNNNINNQQHQTSTPPMVEINDDDIPF